MREFKDFSQDDWVGALQADERALGSPDDEKVRLLYELPLHQVELEIQNRELREAQQALEETRNRYAEWYDFAPVGCVTLTRNGVICNLNLTAASWFARERSSLIGMPIASFLYPGSSSGMFGHLRRAFATDWVVVDENSLRPLGKGRVGKFGWTAEKGLEVAAYNDSTVALDVFSRNVEVSDCIITDHTMAKITGTELTQAVRALNPQVPAILMSGQGCNTEAFGAAGSGVDRYLISADSTISMTRCAGVSRHHRHPCRVWPSRAGLPGLYIQYAPSCWLRVAAPRRWRQPKNVLLLSKPTT